jgi:hypothetical protein
MRIPESWFNELEDLTQPSRGDTVTLATQAYRNMLIAAVKAGKLTPRKATRLFNTYLEEAIQ